MELEVVIVLVLGLIFVSLISYKVFRIWSQSEEAKYTILHKKDFDADYQELQAKYDTALKASQNWKHRYRLLQRDHDIEIDEEDLEYDPTDPEISEEDKLSDLVKKIYPQLPKGLTRIIDAPALQEKLADYASKNPEGVLALFDNFVKKSPLKDASSGQKDAYTKSLEFGV